VKYKLIFMAMFIALLYSTTSFADEISNSSATAIGNQGVAAPTANANVTAVGSQSNANPVSNASSQSIGNINQGTAAPTATANATGNQATATGVSSAGNNSNEIGQSVTVEGTTVNNNFAAGKRGYPIGQAVNFTALPGYFGDNNRPGHQFIPLDKIIMYTPLWNMESARKMDSAKSWGKNLNITPLISKVDRDQRSQTILVTKEMMDTNKVNVWQLAFGTLNATNKNVISSDIFAGILVEASQYGATHIQFFAEGTNTELETEGFGIGLNYTKATDSSITTGGTGWSKGWAGYQNLPWLQFAFLRVEPKDSMATVRPMQPQPQIKVLPDRAPEVIPGSMVPDQAPEVDMAIKNRSQQQ
jgi:hypothetical protein